MAIAPPRRPSEVATAGGPAERAGMRRRVLAGVVRVLVVTGVLLVVYVTAPMDQRPTGVAGVRLGLSLLAIVVVLTWQIRSVSRSPYPTLRGVEVVAVSVPLLVLSFAATYVGMSSASSGAFTEELTRLDAAYFSVTVLATVGFGDIAPLLPGARLAVTAQMLFDLALGALVAKVLVGAVRRRREALAEGARAAQGPSPDGAASGAR
jgi:hypothetical protein